MLKRAKQRGDIFYKIHCGVNIILGFSNRELQALEVRNKKYNVILKKYKNILENINYEETAITNKKNNKIWICWLQGIDKAPDLVKRCVESVYKNCPDSEITIITTNNLFNYIDLPDFIVEKWKKGIITNTHLSDIIRTELLIKYGGLWMDATTFLIGQIPEYVYRKGFFLYRYKAKVDLTITVNSWFIYSEGNHRLLKITRDLLYAYWQKENKLKEYFLWHFFMNMAIKKYPEDYHRIPQISDEMAHMLRNVLGEQYDENYWNDISKLSSVQKLTYKMEKSDKSRTFYDYIIEDNEFFNNEKK